MSLVGEGLSLCGVNDSFVSPRDDEKAYKIQPAIQNQTFHANVCESMGPGETINLDISNWCALSGWYAEPLIVLALTHLVLLDFVWKG